MLVEYVYEQALGPGQIRLLHLRPGTGDVHLTLKPVDLTEALDYDAISYCWGDPNDTQPIYCDEKTLHVTNSLATALRRLRLPDQSRALWADAICINQKDLPEKESQIQLMSQIYSKPRSVIIWLGDDMEGLERIEESIAGALTLLPPEAFETEELRETSQRIFREASQLRKEGKPNFNDHDWAPINNLLCRPWFERKWVIQEVVMADNDIPRVIVCGHIEISWTNLSSIAYRLGSYGILNSIAGLSTINANAPNMASFHTDGSRPLRSIGNTWMIMLIKYFRHRQGITLMDGVMATALFKCTDPRDHLYALLNLSSRVFQLGPDYSLTIHDVCKLFATTVLVEEQNLKILSLVQHSTLEPDKETQGPKLPSWAPDLTLPGINPLVAYTIRSECFHAGGVKIALINVSDDGRVLHLKGRFIDSLKLTTECYHSMPFPSAEDIAPKTGFASRLKMWKRNWFRASRDLAADGNWTELSPERKRAFSETMICGLTGMRDPAPEDVIEAVDVFMAYLFDYFTDGFTLTDEVRGILLTQGGLIETSLLGITAAFRFCVTEKGRFGQVRIGARAGDLFCIVLGAEVPYILRPTGKGTYQLIGECYLHGVMQGETLSDSRYQTTDILLE